VKILKRYFDTKIQGFK